MMKKILILATLFLALVHEATTQEQAAQAATQVKAAQEKASQAEAQLKAAQDKATQAAAQLKTAKDKATQAEAQLKAAQEKAAKEKIAREKADKQAILDLFESSEPAQPAGKIDQIVFAKLKSLNIKPTLCSDTVFVRRAYLDIIGTLPTAHEARKFIENTNLKNKRIALIDRLMERDEFGDYWAMKWGDILRIKAEFPVNLWPNAAQAYHRWVRSSIIDNKPYDQFVREMLTSNGSNFRVPQVNFYRALQSKTPEGITSAVALAFMGSRTDSWPKDRTTGTMVFFSQVGYKPTSEWKEEIVFWDPLRSSKVPGSIAPGNAKPTTISGAIESKSKDAAKQTKEATGKSKDATNKTEVVVASPTDSVPLAAIFPDGTRIQLSLDEDPREVFADWLINPKNPWFARCAVNRVWAWLLGRGIIHEPDDIRKDNPPGNPELLAYLEKAFIASNYDMKALYRLILTSTTYQFSSRPRHNNPKAEANFAAYPMQRLDAEVLIDAINSITGTSDLYTSPIPEPFTYIPKDMRAIAIADGSITSSFLALFGRSARATGMATERTNKHMSSQWLHTLNSGHIQSKLEKSPKLRKLLSSGIKQDQIIEELYLAILSRKPTSAEMHALRAYAKPRPFKNPKKPGSSEKKAAWTKKRNDSIDIIWSLINSTEFLYRH